MEVREASAVYLRTTGYKQTEVGVIPEDWGVVNLGRTCTQVTTGKLDANAMKENGDYRFYTCAKNYYQIDTYAFDTEALLVSGNGANVGYIHYYKGKFNAYQRTYVLSGFLESIKYLQHYMGQKLADRLRVEVNAGNTPYITRGTLTEMKVALPPTKAEQEAIAEALSDADALIESLEQLLAKKRHLKQGAMQELLTGKKRLPGFSGEWEVRKVKQFGEIVTGSTPPTGIKEYWNGDIPWVTPTDISDKKDIHSTERKITILGLASIRRLPSNSVLITCIASIGKNAVLRNEGACNQQINSIIPNKEHDADFLYYLIENSKQYLLGNAGITATMIISKRDFSELDFTVPLKAEQTAIATILSDMDAELAALEAKLAKARSLKQGMMQELLTGRIRLV